MSTTNIERVHQIGEAIQKALESYAYGQSNPEALQEISRLAHEAEPASGYDSYVSEKVTGIKTFADILYSPRKHQKYAQGSTSGADRVRSIVYSYAYKLAHWSPIIPDQLGGLDNKGV